MPRKLAEPEKKSKKEKRPDMDYFKLVRDGLSGFVQMSEMEEVSIVPTCIASYNRATGRGGHPLGRMMLVHGKNQTGKSALALAVLNSLADAGFPSQNFDAEFAAERRWYNFVCTNSTVVDKPTGDLDELFSDVEKLLANVDRLHREKKMPPDIGAAIVVDTLTKLMPRDIVEQIKKEGIDKQYPIQALYVSTWMKVVIPQLNRTNSALIIVLQERENVNARSPWDVKWKVTLGNALMYDNCLRVRVVGNEKLKEKDEVVGMKCNCEVQSNKISGTTLDSFSFFTATGTGECPIGLDFQMEAAEEAKERKWLKTSKGEVVLEVPGEEGLSIGRNMPEAVRFLRKDERVFKELVQRLNEDSIRKVKEEYVG